MDQKAILEHRLLEAKAKVYDLNMMSNTLNQQIGIFNNQIVEISQQLENLSNVEKKPEQPTEPAKPAEENKPAGAVSPEAGADKPGIAKNDPKPADSGEAKKGKGQPAPNKAKGNSK